MMLLCGRDEKEGTFAMRPGSGARKRFSDTSVIRNESSLIERCAFPARDTTPLESFEQDDYVRQGPFANRLLSDWVEDFIAVRRATLSLLRNLDEAGLDAPRRCQQE